MSSSPEIRSGVGPRPRITAPVRAAILTVATLALVLALLAVAMTNGVWATLLAMAAAFTAAVLSSALVRRVGPPEWLRDPQRMTTQLRALDERLAAQRPDVELTNNRLQKVMGRIGDRLVLVNSDLTIVTASPDVGAWLGLGDRDISGENLSWIGGDGHPLVVLAREALAARRDVSSRPLVLGGAQPRQVAAAVQYIEDEGRSRALLSLRDAESMRKLEAHVDYATKLGQLGRVMSGVSHEIKNPLNAMVIHVEVLRAKLESGNTDVGGQLDVLDAEIKRLDRVVKTFLDFTRPVEARLEAVDLNSVVEGVARLAQAEAQGRGVRLALQLAPEPLPIKADADLLTQALVNVVINGCQAMASGGTLRVGTRRGDDRTPRVEIEDSGVGIGPEAREKIFNLYYTTKEKGSGIGLAQTFRAVQIHNGRIDVQSEPGRGTTFTIELPEG